MGKLKSAVETAKKTKRVGVGAVRLLVKSDFSDLPIDFPTRSVVV